MIFPFSCFWWSAFWMFWPGRRRRTWVFSMDMSWLWFQKFQRVRRAVYELYDLWAGRNRVEDVDLMSQEDIVCVFWDALNIYIYIFFKNHLLSLRLMLEYQMKNRSAVMCLSIFWPGPCIKSQENEWIGCLSSTWKNERQKGRQVWFLLSKNTQRCWEEKWISQFLHDKTKGRTSTLDSFLETYIFQQLKYESWQKKPRHKANPLTLQTGAATEEWDIEWHECRVCVSWLFLVLLEGVHLVFLQNSPDL